MNRFSNVVFSVGYYGPHILFITSILMVVGTGLNDPLLLAKQILLLMSWNGMNVWLNGALKKLIKQPRPRNMIKINEQDKEHSHQYGMPSGHAQLAANNLVFIAFLFGNHTITAIAAIQTLLTIYQRYSFRMHTASQLLAGTTIGGVSGYALYTLYKQMTQKTNREKTQNTT